MSHVKTHTRISKKGKLSLVHSYEDKRHKKARAKGGKELADAKALVADTARELNAHLGQKGIPNKKKTAQLKRELEDAKANVAALGGAGRKPVKHVIKAPDPGMLKMRETVTGLLRTEDGRQEFAGKIKAGGFSKALPEVLNLYGVEQGDHHPLPDAFDHTMELFKHLPKDASDNVLWATLLHDIGKAETQRFVEKRGTIFDGHEYKGYQMVGKTLKRLGFDKKDAEEISYLVLHHGNLRTQILRGETAKAHKFVNHPHFESLLAVHKADVCASGRDPKEVVERTALLKQTESFRKDLYDNVARELNAREKAVELNDDGSVSLYLDNDRLVDKAEQVDPKVDARAKKALERNGLSGKWDAYSDYDPNSGWVAVHFEPKTQK